jgi:hypothetical protein
MWLSLANEKMVLAGGRLMFGTGRQEKGRDSSGIQQDTADVKDRGSTIIQPDQQLDVCPQRRN